MKAHEFWDFVVRLEKVDDYYVDNYRWGEHRTRVLRRDNGTHVAIDYRREPEKGVVDAGEPYEVEPVERTVITTSWKKV